MLSSTVPRSPGRQFTATQHILGMAGSWRTIRFGSPFTWTREASRKATTGSRRCYRLPLWDRDPNHIDMASNYPMGFYANCIIYARVHRCRSTVLRFLQFIKTNFGYSRNFEHFAKLSVLKVLKLFGMSWNVLNVLKRFATFWTFWAFWIFFDFVS